MMIGDDQQVTISVLGTALTSVESRECDMRPGHVTCDIETLDEDSR